jgi:hypothetical protein
MTNMNQDIPTALKRLRANADRYSRAERYYNGEHDLAFATEKFQSTFGTLFREFALNLCPIVCDAVRDKLRVTGFSLETPDSGDDHGTETPADSVSHAAKRIWRRNRMGTRSGEVHKEALRSGDAYVIVWADANGRAAIYPNRARSMYVVYDDEEPGRILWAAKYWPTQEGYVRLNLFYPDRIEKYISRNRADGLIPDAAGFIPFEAKSEKAVVANPYGRVPVFHFANNADLGAAGRSELESAFAIQDGLNKSVLDMLVAMEFAAFRQRWVAGIEVNRDEDGTATAPFSAGVDHLWIAESSDARFGDFQGSDLVQFLKVKDSFRLDIASVTGTPLHYFMQNTTGLPSGESLKKAETRFLAKVRNRQESFGQVWADAMSLALAIEGSGSDNTLLTSWEDPAPLAEREFLENILLKKQIGLPVEQALIEAGYGAADVKSFIEGTGN